MTRLVKVWGNTYLNPNCVGKVELTQNFSSGSRTNTTVAYDLTGQHVL